MSILSVAARLFPNSTRLLVKYDLPLNPHLPGYGGVSSVQWSRSPLPEPGTPINFIIGTVPNCRDQDAVLTSTTPRSRPHQDVLSRLKIVNIYFSYKQSTCSIQNTQATKLFRSYKTFSFKLLCCIASNVKIHCKS